MANWLEKLANPQTKMERQPRDLGTEEFIELTKLPLAEVYTQLKEKGVQFAGSYDLKWIKLNPDKEEARRYKTGGEFYFFGADKGGVEGYSVRRLQWVANPKDPKKGEFKEEVIAITGMTAPIIWGSNRDKADAIPRRVVFIL